MGELKIRTFSAPEGCQRMPDALREQYLAGNTSRAAREAPPPSTYSGLTSVTNGIHNSIGCEIHHRKTS
jgi:hypothetical protein